MTEHDPDASVQLPHGTDVITRVERTLDDHTIRAGSVGRVVATSSAAIDVRILGVGVVRYARDEVTPFRSGQVRYALARDAAWNALHANIVLEATVGSQAWGLAEPHSDLDRRGVFVLPFSWVSRLGNAPEDLVSVDGSATYWEIAKLVSQAVRADPNTLELLFVPSVRALDPLGEWILQARDAFVSARIHSSFGQYALSQLKKLKQALRLAEHRDLVLGWVREDSKLSLDAAAARLAEAAKIVAPSQAERHATAKVYLKQLCASLFDQGLLLDKSFAALREYARTQHESSALPRSLRPKNAYNLLRLLITATHWLRTGSPTFEMTGEHHAELLAIKRGEVELETVLLRAETLSEALDSARRATALPERPNLELAQRLLLKVREESARRWLAAAPGPFGADASPVPVPEWKI